MEKCFTLLLVTILFTAIVSKRVLAQIPETRQVAPAASANGDALLASNTKDKIYLPEESDSPVKKPDATVVAFTKLGWVELPTELCSRTDVAVADLSGNLLETLPDAMGNWSRLSLLDVTKNHLEHYPAALCHFPNLEKLTLDLNYLSTLPQEFGQLKNLRELTIRHNMLCSLPSGIGQLKTLRTLILTGNLLQTLPAEIGELKSLEVLRLDNNDIRTLPDSIGELKGSLRILSLKGNPLTNVDVNKLRALLPETMIEL